MANKLKVAWFDGLLILDKLILSSKKDFLIEI